MKKKTMLIGLIMAAVVITGCELETAGAGYPSSNKMWHDNTNYFDKAIINLGNEVIEVEVDKWEDFEDGEQLQILTKDGTVYLTSSFNCTLIRTAR